MATLKSIPDTRRTSEREEALESEPALPASTTTLSEVAPPVPVDRATRTTRIRERAYARAQARGFEPGAELADWLAAEREVDAELVAGGAPGLA